MTKKYGLYLNGKETPTFKANNKDMLVKFVSFLAKVAGKWAWVKRTIKVYATGDNTEYYIWTTSFEKDDRFFILVHEDWEGCTDDEAPWDFAGMVRAL
jgi:hypothetical protein